MGRREIGWWLLLVAQVFLVRCSCEGLGLYRVPCEPDCVHGSCQAGTCRCDPTFAGAACERCSDASLPYPDCVDPCRGDPCHGHGVCDGGLCTCDAGFAGACDSCANPNLTWPDCVECTQDSECAAQFADRPYCLDHRCVACLATTDPATAPPCRGVCALGESRCVADRWQCDAPLGQAEVEVCDGFDNDCDGLVDEDVCTPCAPRLAEIEATLPWKADLDFDWQCNAYLTTLISGPDYVDRVAADPTVAGERYFGNANQNMGFGLLDPDPRHHRMVVTYSCCAGCACQSVNGLTLLHTCDPSQSDCGCAGQSNCPGFLNEPFLAAGFEDTRVTMAGRALSSPTGLAVGPHNAYFVGNFRPRTCSNDPACDPCDPDHPDLWCSTDRPNCCDSSALGRLVQFTLPEAGQAARWRVVWILTGEHIGGLAAGRDGSVMVGTWAASGGGNLRRYDPVHRTLSLVAHYPGTVFSVTQARQSGDWYVDVQTSPGLYRLAEDGTPLALPPGVPADPGGDGALQVGPDNHLYRVVWSPTTLQVYPLP